MASKWTGSYVIGTSVMKELSQVQYVASKINAIEVFFILFN